MPENIWNPWKMTTIGLLLVGATALVTTLVVGYRGDQAGSQPARSVTYSGTTGHKISMPRQIDADSCNAYADHKKHDADYQAAYRACMHQKGY